MSIPKSIYPVKPKTLPKSLGFSRYALDFDGADDYVDVNVSQPQSAFTYSAWIYPESDGSSELRGIVLAGSSGVDWNGLYLGGGSFKFYIKDANGIIPDLTSSIPSLNKWYHIVGVFKSGDSARLYIDRQEVASRVNSSLGDALASNITDIGRWSYSNPQREFDGTIDEIRIYDRTLSESEIRRNMLNYHNPTKNGLVGWWRFEEGTGLTAHDSSGNGNDGTLYGPTWIEQRKWEMRAESGL